MSYYWVCPRSGLRAPRKIRQLKSDLKRAGFVERPRAACGRVGPLRGWGDEAVLGRPPRTAPGRHRRWLAPGRGGPPLRRRAQHHQAMAPSSPGDRWGAGLTATRTVAADRTGGRAGAGGSGSRRSRCHACRARCDVGGDDRHRRKSRDDVAGAPTSWLATQKKSLVAAERDETARATWRLDASTLDSADLVFVDETSTHTALTRRRARAPRGERAVGRTPRNHGPNVTLLATLTPAGIGPAVAIPGAVDGAAFIAYAERVLAPSLRPGQVVILDNLSAHKSEGVRTAVEAVGARLLFCRPTHPTSTRSNSHVPRSRSASVPPPNAALRACLPPPQPPSTPSPPRTPVASTPTAASRS